MGTLSPGVYSFNSGIVDAEALSRIDLQKMRFAAETMENLLPRVMGSCRFRPGSRAYVNTHGNASPIGLPFVVNVSTKALIEITSAATRVLLDGVPVTRPAVTAVVTNGTFDTNLAGWTVADEPGTSSSWRAGGYLQLLGDGSNFAMLQQSVTVNQIGTEHALRIAIERGPVTFAVGTAAGLDNLIAETLLRTGEHSLAFTPTGSAFHISVSSSEALPKLVDSIVVEAAGIMTLPSPWGGSYQSIRHQQSIDVMFIACTGIQQRRIERRSQRSWSIVEYQAEDGPFRFPNLSRKTITPSAIEGEIVLTASSRIFRSQHVGSIWRLSHFGQAETATLSAAGQATEPIRVSGLSDVTEGGQPRQFSIEISGTFVATVTLQRSFGEPGAWVDYKSYTAPTVENIDDGLDNQIVFYRATIKAGQYTSGSAAVSFTFSGGVQIGIVRVTEFTNQKSVKAEVLRTLGKTTETTDWEEGTWSDYRGWPSALAFFDGRLWWAFQDKLYGSISDAYESFDDEVEGDAGPVIRSIATGTIDGIKWLLPLHRLLAGNASQEISIRSSSFDEPITPTQFTAREFSNRGAADTQAMKIDGRGVYVQRNGSRVFDATFNYESQDYTSKDATRLATEVCGAGVVAMAVQRQPDTRVWAWLADGTAAVLTYEPADEVIAWTTVVTDGDIKWITVLPGKSDDEVWLAVERTNSGGTVVMWEKLALMSECVGGSLSMNLDAHIVYSGAPTATIGGLGHLEGKTAAMWADGKPYPGPYQVSGGSIVVETAVSNAVVGLIYEGKFKSARIGLGAVAGTAINKRKRIIDVALIMQKVGWAGIRIGKDFTTMRSLPGTIGNGRPLIATEVLDHYVYDATSFPGGWGVDERFCFKISAPYPAIFQAFAMTTEVSEPHLAGASATSPTSA